MLGVQIYLIWVTDFIFWVKKNWKHFDCYFECLILERHFGHVLLVILYLARMRAGQYSECLNEVYNAYTYNKSYFI